MATVNKNFKIKQGLVVEGSTATVGGNNVLVETASDTYILDLIGGETLVKSVEATQLEVSGAGKLSVKANVFDASGSAAAAQSAAASDATTKANAAQAAAISTAASDATSKANAAKTAAEATASADATSKANAAQAAAEATASADATSKANAAKSGAEATAAAALTAAISTEVSNRNTAIGTAVDNLVDGAPALLNTLNELAAAINDDANYTTTITTALGTKANAADVTSALAGKENALTSAEFTNKAIMGSSGNSYGLVGTSEYLDVKDNNGYNKEIELDIAAVEAKLTTDGYAKQSDIATALSSAQSYADALTTSDVAEGTAQYFTDARSKASAADLLTGATKTNITITGSGSGLVITAENGVADSTTTDLTEGTNLYFTNARAISATAASYDVLGAAAAAQSAAATDATDKVASEAALRSAADIAALAAAASDATTKANAAQSAAEATASADATSKANAAKSGAEATAAAALTTHSDLTVAHGATGAVVGTTNTQTLTNKTIGDTLNFTGAGAMTINSDSHIVLTPAAGSSVKWGTDVLATQAYADQAETDAKAYTDTEIAALVDSAPALLDTLNELAAAIGDNPNYATDLATSVGTKVSKAGDTMTGLLVLSADPSANLGAATKQYVDTAETDAVATAESYTDGEITDALVTAQGYASTAQGNAQTHTTNAINALDTDDIEEGSTNLYFTAARAVTALQNVTPNFTEVEVNSVAKQVAATSSAPTAGVQMAYAWPKSAYRSAEFLVKVGAGGNTEVSKVLLTLDTADNIAITEYGIVATNVSLAGVSAVVSGSNVELRVTTLNNTSVITVVGTLLV